MRRAGLGLVDSRPISYLGVDPLTSQLFSFSLLLSAFLFIHFAFYVRHTYKLKNRFLLYFLIGQAGQIIAAVTPFGKASNYKLVHTIAAFTLAFSLPLLINAFAYAQKNSSHFVLYKRLLRLEQLTFIVGIGLFTFTEGVAPLGEALPAIGFHVWIIAITIVSLKTKPFANE